MTTLNGNPLDALWMSFVFNRALTYDLLDEVSDEDLLKPWPRPGLDSISKQVQELAAVERAFDQALVSGTMDFSGVPDVMAFDRVSDRAKLKGALKAADEAFAKTIAEGVAKPSVRWDDVDVSSVVHLSNLISHEVFHQGQMAMACYALGIGLPESWRTNWAMPKAGQR
ncbi:MAG TPA: hypothetical protein VMF58_16125 [Rhizomicrobium sp.]|nr:hypothetical protein [Rhizomicrobium sp.]